MSFKLLIAFIFLILGIFLQLFIGGTGGIWLNFTLAALVTAAFLLNFLELLLLCLVAVFILNWQPAFSLEIVLYTALPLVFFSFRKLFSFKLWLAAPAAIFLSFLIFYLAIGPRFLVAAPTVFLLDLVVGLAFGAIFFKICEMVAKT